MGVWGCVIAWLSVGWQLTAAARWTVVHGDAEAERGMVGVACRASTLRPSSALQSCSWSKGEVVAWGEVRTGRRGGDGGVGVTGGAREEAEDGVGGVCRGVERGESVSMEACVRA